MTSALCCRTRAETSSTPTRKAPTHTATVPTLSPTSTRYPWSMTRSTITRTTTLSFMQDLIMAYQAANYSKFGFQGYHHSSPNYWNPSYDKALSSNSVTPNLGIYNPNYFNTPNFYPNYDSDWFRQASSGVTHYNPNEWWKYISPSNSHSDVTIERSVSFPPRTLTHGRRRRNAELVEAAAAAKGTLTGAEALRIALVKTRQRSGRDVRPPTTWSCAAYEPSS
ncbi:unnamed protein product [Leptidea sinapis]|uniref:Uncharacterized protein n=1 Tax=Leptidea sinapis TaxID=189913 RepID=A0A5E4PT37_9NEOP|nr:unnamed protein product [Leptidea sinapis]